MSRRQENQNSDLVAIGLYSLLVLLGWANIYAAEYDPEQTAGIFSLSNSSGKQLIWIASSFILGGLIYVLDLKFFNSFSYIIYIAFIVLLIAVLFLGKEVSGAKSWFEIGAFRFQPSEFAKYATLLALAGFLANSKEKFKGLTSRELMISALIFLVPMGLTILQGDAGTAMVYVSMMLVLFREGMSPVVLLLILGAVTLFILTLVLDKVALIIGIIFIALIAFGLAERTPRSLAWTFIGTVFAISLVISVDFAMNDVFESHQRKRIMSLLNPNADPLGVGWNVTQSKIAIGSGGLSGKGFLEGTQTKFDFVPEQTTDFIFCTVGEEHGWIGTFTVVALFCALLIRLVDLAERQKSRFARIFGYGVVSVLFFHFAINIAMTIGLFPVIGIPLPFFSYGGSSLWAFSLMLFTFLKLDAHRMQVLQR